MTTLDKNNVDAWLDSVDIDKSTMQAGSHLAKIGAALQAAENAQADLDRAVREAHSAGDSWSAIGLVLGTSRQAAHRKYAQP